MHQNIQHLPGQNTIFEEVHRTLDNFPRVPYDHTAPMSHALLDRHFIDVFPQNDKVNWSDASTEERLSSPGPSPKFDLSCTRMFFMSFPSIFEEDQSVICLCVRRDSTRREYTYVLEIYLCSCAVSDAHLCSRFQEDIIAYVS